MTSMQICDDISDSNIDGSMNFIEMVNNPVHLKPRRSTRRAGGQLAKLNQSGSSKSRREVNKTKTFHQQSKKLQQAHPMTIK